MKFNLLILLLFSAMLSCSTSKTSVIVTDSYDQTENVTTLTIIPYGSLYIPGRWTKTSYNQVSGQHFFDDQEGNTIAITKTLQEKYSFYTAGLSDKEFAQKFFEWEKEYFEKQGYEIKEKSSGDNFVIWTAKGKDANTIFLYGGKDKFAYNFAVLDNEWSEKRKIDFLTQLFHNN